MVFNLIWVKIRLIDDCRKYTLLDFTLSPGFGNFKQKIFMQFYSKMPNQLKPYFKKELELFDIEFKTGNLKKSWNHLERAHIIGQKYPYSHTLAHWKMLQFGFAIKSTKEIFGQIPRLAIGGVKSFVGTVPLGNPGGANVSAIKPFPMEEDLKEIFIKAGISAN